MSMGKEQIVMSAIGGVSVVASLVIGFFLYTAIEEKSEIEDQLESLTEEFRGFYKASVFPSVKSIASIKTNGVAYAAWLDDARKLAAEGDKRFPEESAPAFKQRLSEEVRRLVNLPGGLNGKIAAPDFLLGFDAYLGESAVLPPKDDLPRLASQLDTVSKVVEILSKSGALQVMGVECKAPAKKVEEAPARGKKPAKKVVAEESSTKSELNYVFTFMTRPAAFVAVLNALAADERFFVVSNVSLKESQDRIVEKITAKENPQAGASASSSRRRRRHSVQEEAPVSSEGTTKEDRLVVDPEMDAPLSVSFTLTVHDFGRAE